MEPTRRDDAEARSAFEAHVRACNEGSSTSLCSLDLTVAKSSLFSGFSSFKDAEAELRRTLDPLQLATVLDYCERHTVRNAFEVHSALTPFLLQHVIYSSLL